MNGLYLQVFLLSQHIDETRAEGHPMRSGVRVLSHRPVVRSSPPLPLLAGRGIAREWVPTPLSVLPLAEGWGEGIPAALIGAALSLTPPRGGGKRLAGSVANAK
jgi:hypothetical protein